ncbi:MAG: hypothetical protein GXY77_16575 [Fibrobacter sp.]|nr:hypothetical protein [Fibrobacter sp.]
MKKFRSFRKHIPVLLLLFSVLSAENNKGARIAVDNCCSTGILNVNCPPQNEKVSAIWICGAENLTGFNLTVEYDHRSMKFVSAEKGNSDGDVFLESCGAQAGPFMVIPTDGKIEIASGIKGKYNSVAPDGDGVLVYVKFSIRDNADDCSVKITKALVSDISLHTDTLIFVEE